MKKISKKLSLNRETLVALSADQLEGVAGGDIGGPTKTTGTLTSRIGCPSRLPTVCPQDPIKSRLACTSIPR
jgi:hypothetical protein